MVACVGETAHMGWLGSERLHAWFGRCKQASMHLLLPPLPRLWPVKRVIIIVVCAIATLIVAYVLQRVVSLTCQWRAIGSLLILQHKQHGRKGARQPTTDLPLIII